MLVWSRSGRALVWALFALVFAPLVLAPLAILGIAAFAGDWNSVLPASWTSENIREATAGTNSDSLVVSVETALGASLIAIVVGTWAAIAARGAPRFVRRLTDAVFHLPVAVPSVVVGLGMLVAFSDGPILLNGTKWIVIAAHAVLVVTFAYSTVSAGLDRTDAAFAEVAASLGASPARVLLRVRLPMLLPSITAAASLAIALSMGEVGATIMVYPAEWRTLPVSIFTLTDRGKVLLGSAVTVVLLVATLVVLMVVGLLKGRVEERRRRR
ncbi:phosphonate ABC transporter permease [Embleya scabrispora]|uniref:Phosphonate ABC transporter permease n=1 Tax=Embleya scabrispora TaxID=159449 RepID=A0A1T3NZ97_9ACTN|nr:ABC transporter permease subunit [Embleya scabrispora]OPC82167.1 phosphonate ABC transporter permease [Embleya scabrispora]